MRFKFNTSLDLKECQKRLRERITSRELGRTVSDPVTMGWVWGRWFYLWRRKYVNLAGQHLVVRNSFATVCFAMLRSNQGETSIKVYIGMHPLVIIFLSIWFGGLVGLGGFAILSVAKDIANTNTLLALCLVLALMIAFGIILVVSGKLLSKDDQSELIRFIKNSLDASDSH